MKAAKIDFLKKKLLIVELPRLSNYTLGSRGLFVEDLETKESHVLKGSYTLLGKPDEIKESDAEELVEQSIHSGLFAHYVKDIPVNTYCYKTATKSLLSAIESVVFWENPLGKEPEFEEYVYDEDDEDFHPQTATQFQYDYDIWHSAQSRTFDRNRSLIFIEN